MACGLSKLGVDDIEIGKTSPTDEPNLRESASTHVVEISPINRRTK